MEEQIKQNDSLLNILNGVTNDANERIDNLEVALEKEVSKTDALEEENERMKVVIQENADKMAELTEDNTK